MGESAVFLGNEQVAVWPDGQRIETLGHPAVLATRFDDTSRYHPRLIARILDLAAHPGTAKHYFRGAGGTKVHHIDRWNCSEADLVHARARELYRRALGRETAVVDLCWANVYRDGEYCMPHSHLRATASVVYFLDSGDDDPDDVLAGRFFFADSRLPTCCEHEPEKMTTPHFPDSRAGTMLIFPGQLIHSVNPYRGSRPRITMSWNLNDVALPARAIPDGKSPAS
jgi:hypothetical protein